MTGRRESAWRLYCLLNEICIYIAHLYVLLTVRPGTVRYTEPNWCTIFLGKFTLISFLYMFRASMCPSSGETTVFMRHLVLAIPPYIADSHPYRITSTKCLINTVVSPYGGHTVARNV